VKVLICQLHRFELWTAPEWLGPRLRSEFPQLDVVQLGDFNAVEREIADSEVFVGYSLKPEQFRAAWKLKWIHTPTAAVHQLLLPDIVSSQAIITNGAEVSGPIVAEHAFALVLALAKRLPQARDFQRERKWAQAELWRAQVKPREIAGSTLCVIGLGAIGREVVRIAKALSMRVIAVREHPQRGAEGADEVCGMDSLERALSADFVIVAAALTEKTRAVINAKRLAAMRRDAYLINVSRGPLVDDDALIAALREERIAGAALDVFAQEPLPADSPYWELDTVLITPHTAAVTAGYWERQYELLNGNMKRFIAGEPLHSLVDKRRGY
jgi:phosphoglycerate dehydrogenase-like enzyme